MSMILLHMICLLLTSLFKGQQSHTEKRVGARQFECRTLFVDIAMSYLFLQNQVTLATEPLKSKNTFKREACSFGVKINKYQADQGLYKSQEFLKDIEIQGQWMRFNDETMTYMMVILEIHGIMNLFLLVISFIRCIYWKCTECNQDVPWMLNWLAYGIFHINVLIAYFVSKAQGHIILEHHLLFLDIAMILSYLSTGVFLLDPINKAIAVVQLAFYLVLWLKLCSTTSQLYHFRYTYFHCYTPVCLIAAKQF